MTVRAFISGLSGPVLTEAERAFFREADPWGFILFRRNVDTPEQVSRLTASLRECVGRADAPVLIDQEGGRVQRLGPPHWRAYPNGADYLRLGGALDAACDLARLGGKLIARDLLALGVTVDCLPVLDVPVEGASDVIGARAYARDPETVAMLGRAAADGLLAGGVLPVMKHAPGHGRATLDTHLALPRVTTSLAELEQTDFLPFRRNADLPAAMTAHVVFEAVDPDRPATTSRRVIETVLRGSIGFDGLLMTDDLSMQALQGGLGERAAQALTAGCDVVLHCNGVLAEMEAVAAETAALSGPSAGRANAALQKLAGGGAEFDVAEAEARFERALRGAA